LYPGDKARADIHQHTAARGLLEAQVNFVYFLKNKNMGKRVYDSTYQKRNFSNKTINKNKVQLGKEDSGMKFGRA
jgi:hypothetical protein